MGETGFTFEYSATFGQALSAARNDPLTAEYGKVIYFDYSYRYFYSDGFGKDFRILNLQEDSRVAQTEMLLLGNLLSFYEQMQIFQERAGELRPYNLEKPLWVFVGSTVNAVYSENREKRSDVLTVARFLHHVLENKGDWVGQGIQKLLRVKAGWLLRTARTSLPGVLQSCGTPVSPRRNYIRIFWRGFSMLRRAAACIFAKSAAGRASWG